MANVDALVKAYESYVGLPWSHGLAGPQKVWFALYSPSDERRLRCRIPAFEDATKRSGHGWRHLDLADAFPRWMAGHEYREEYFAAPNLLTMALDDFVIAVGKTAAELLDEPGADEGSVTALSGIASLFGLARFSTVLKQVEPHIRGRLLVFFPGERDGSNYRLLDARDGWNYHAAPITGLEN